MALAEGQRHVLTLHGVGTPPRALEAGEESVWISEDELASVLDAMTSDFEVTVDDGNASDVEVVLPALRERGLTATFFVCAGRLGQAGFLGEADLRALLDAGMRVGSHGHGHRPWRGLSDADLAAEVVGARERLAAAAGAPVEAASCPFGAYDRRVLRALRGFSWVGTSDEGPSRPGDWLVARTTVRAGEGAGVVARARAARPTPLRRAALLVKRWR